MPFAMIPVTSSNVAAIGYDPPARICRVQFVNGTLYDYADVPPAVFSAFLNVPSKGQFVDRVLKFGGFEVTKVTPDDAP